MNGLRFEEWRDELALALIPGLGPKLTRAVIDHFGSPRAALAADARSLEAVPLVGAKLAQKFADGFRKVEPRLRKEWEMIESHQIRLLRRSDDEYPRRLTTIDDAPELLYMKGNLLPEDSNCLGIVGSRSCTSYGRRMAEQIAGGLCRAGWTIVSGLARGIDGAAHQGAITAGGRTIAVLAGGLARIYPPEHDELAKEVAAHGALVTETPLTVEPQPGMFPARNRIISGICRAIVVVEANGKSGALITASHAAEQGREVFAVPSNADSLAGAGCLELIRKGARLVRSASDILEDLQGIAPPDPPKLEKSVRNRKKQEPTLFEPPVEGPPPGLDDLQKKIWENLTEPRHVDELTREVASGSLAAPLMKLEMKKVVRRLPGNKYERIR